MRIKSWFWKILSAVLFNVGWQALKLCYHHCWSTGWHRYYEPIVLWAMAHAWHYDRCEQCRRLHLLKGTPLPSGPCCSQCDEHAEAA